MGEMKRIGWRGPGCQTAAGNQGGLRTCLGARSGSAGGGTDFGADGAKGGVGVLAEGGDRREADHDDQGQHDRIFDSRRAIFTLDEIHCSFGKLTHGTLLKKNSDTNETRMVTTTQMPGFRSNQRS
jgi:hypothetical protein